MKFRNGFKIGLVLGVLVLLCSSASWADWDEVFFDDFDDGDFDGWDLTHTISGYPTNPPDVVTSPQGYSLRGVGSGYSPDPGLSVWLTHPFSVTNVSEMKIEMRAKSGPQLPNSVAVYIVSGSDYYFVRDYGESGVNETVDWYSWVGGSEQNYRKYIGSQAFEWHDFAWTRDADGWWSLSMDNVVVWENFGQDNQLTSFDKIGIQLLRNQSEIEWVRISSISESVEADIDINPDTLNMNSKGKWITCYIELPEDYDVDDIDVGSILLEYLLEVQHSDVQDAVLMVKFDRQDLIIFLESVVGIIPPDDVPLTVTGELKDGRRFEGSDTIRVIDKGKGKDEGKGKGKK